MAAVQASSLSFKTSLRQGYGFLRIILKQKRYQLRWHWCGRHAGKGKLVSTRSYLQILGTSTDYSSPSVLLFTDSYRYLFNCGENTVRILHELDRLKMNISRVFLTGMTWQSHIAGLPTLIKGTATINGGPLSIYGPEGISKFLEDISTFSSDGLRRRDALKLFTSTEFVNNNTDEQEEQYVDDNLSIMPIIFERKYQDVSYSERQCICYICEFADLPGHFLREKAVELGVSEEHFNDLAIGNQVLSSYGQKVDPSQVLSQSAPGQVFMIVDCPSEEISQNLVDSVSFSEFYSSTGSKTPHVIIHITPLEIFQSEPYKAWREKFGKGTTHILVNKQVVKQGTPFLRSISIQSALSAIDRDIFPPIAVVDKDVSMESQDVWNDCIPAETRLCYQFRPLKFEGLTKRNLRHGYEASDFLKMSQEASKKLDEEDLKSVGTSSVTFKEEHLQTMADSKVTFLGTGFAIPSYGRGQSAILVHTKADKAILLDCGEGTYAQLCSLYKEGTADIVASLKCLFISHRHLDHHIGLMQLLLEYKHLAEERQLPPLPIIGPWRLFQWLTRHSKLMGKDLPIRFLPFGEVKNKKVEDQIQEILDALDLSSLEIVSVLHTRDSHGIILNHSSGWKLVYSGDCVPSYNLITKGKNATLLIHEATYFEIPKEELIRGRHCTLAEAIMVSRDMEASYTILTHFSKYWKIYWPRESGSLRLGPGISAAFDFMTVRFSDLPRLHKLRPAIAKVFQKPRDTRKPSVKTPTPREQRISRRERNQELFKMLF